VPRTLEKQRQQGILHGATFGFRAYDSLDHNYLPGI
jgi:hypothetical protein